MGFPVELARATRTARPKPLAKVQLAKGARRARAKFLRYFPGGFRDPTYVDWERGYKEQAHRRWQAELDEKQMRALVRAGEHAELARRALGIEGRTNLLFSFEKMAVRDAVKSEAGARAFACGLVDLLHGSGDLRARFERWVDVVADLPRKQTRVLTWPLATVFGFLGEPAEQIFLKPNVTRRAAAAYGFDFHYASRPTWDTYASLLAFARTVRRDISDLRPRDLIDLQSFIWVQGSDEYP